MLHAVVCMKSETGPVSVGGGRIASRASAYSGQVLIIWELLEFMALTTSTIDLQLSNPDHIPC